MIEKVYYYDCDNLNVYHNQGLQNYIFQNIPDDSMVFVMWKNSNSVLVSANKSAYSECNVSLLELENTKIARKNNSSRTTFNDLGCLNFAFFVYLNNYDAASKINTVYQALCKCKLPVYLNEQQEIMLEGKVIVDNSFLIQKERCMLQGTIYWDCDKARRGRLLKDNKYKTQLGNITDNFPCVNMGEIKKNLLQAVADQYGPVYPFSISDTYDEFIEDFQSFSYIYQIDKPYSLILNCVLSNDKRIQIYVDMLKNKILKIDAFMDNQDEELIAKINEVFKGMNMDSIIFRSRMNNCDERLIEDMLIIYQTIKKESYQV